MGDPGYLIGNLVVLAVILVGIGMFSRPNAARFGNLAIALALICALGVEVARNPLNAPLLVLAALAVGSLGGLAAAKKVNMTQIPALVGFQNGAGGLASCLVSLVQLTREPQTLDRVGVVAAVAAMIVGAVTFSGSMVASGKLAGLLRQKPVALPGHRWILLVVSIVLLAAAFGATSVSDSGPTWPAIAVVLFALLLGLVFSARVGGADMPVLISLLNAFSGLSAGICGVVVKSQVLTACGATVAASGLILTYAMCRAMNRNVWAIVWPAAPAAVPESAPDGGQDLPSETVPSDQAVETPAPPSDPFPQAAEVLQAAGKIIVIPGYGMALAHAQIGTVGLANRLVKMGKDVKFAVHPLAGRMPGHMHVLLAEADVDPDMLFDLNEVNSEFAATDVALIVGACDVVNPAAASVEGTPISGMPILAAQDAARVIVCNLDARPGYSGVENLLYRQEKTLLLLGDAQETMSRLLNAIS
ncbi:MAG: NAD(P)(+) transhydrogenase (Re/Si-specific) subunit beta [Planctomycetaceae bacterium]|nr:NAD(P)(+) transhydrogenase (Re/Si-specific) subunit beta [Planctomycetaceae bacterium]